MPETTLPPTSDDPISAARNFVQGVGLLCQWVGVTLFIVMMFICCSSSLLSKETATRGDLGRIGVHRRADPPDHPIYSAQLAITLTVSLGVFFGMALAGIGLGLQGLRRRVALFAVLLSGFAALFWCWQTIFFAAILRSILLTLGCAVLALLFAAIFGFSIAAARAMRVVGPMDEDSLLPRDYQMPFSQLNQDSPQIRLAAELEQRRRKLAVQQKELEMLEARLKRRQADDH